MTQAHVRGETARVIKQPLAIEREKNRIIELVQDDLNNRNQAHQYFRGSNLDTYTQASIMQFVGHRPKPEWKKDYQYNIFEPITRDKVMAIISKGSGLFEAQFFNTNKMLNGHSQTLATSLGAFYEDSRYALNDTQNNKDLMLEALITPKAIWYEGWRFQERVIRDVVDRDEDGNPIYGAKKKIHYNGPWGQIVPVEELVPGSIKIRDPQEQPRITWITRMSLIQFKRSFPAKQYPNAPFVQPFKYLFDEGLTGMLANPEGMKADEVEVVYCFEKWDDKLSTIASGVKLTRLNSPMPFAHKDYPFAWAGFEPFRSNFLYDMPLPMKILDMQDMSNENFNLSLDMVWRALNEVVLVGGGDGINDDVLYGGGMVDVDNPNNFKKLEFGSAFGFNSSNAVMDRARRAIESSSVDAPNSGQSGNRAVTAREVTIARETAMEITSLFIQNLESMEQQKASLRIQNQLDRYRRPVEWQDAIGEDLAKKSIPVFREITARNARLDNGKRGTVTVNITETPRSSKELNKVNDADKNEMTQTIDISPELIRMIKPMVRIVANSSVKKSKALEVAESRQFFGDALSAPQIFNVREVAKEYVEKLGKNADDVLAKEQAPAEDPLASLMSRQRGAGGDNPQSIKPMNDSIDQMLNTGI